MKNLVSGIAIALLLGAIYTAPIQAQTYDGVTPAEETVCGVLLDENREAEGLLPVTKGLYGLCVAYCEAQDQVDDLMDELTYEDIGSDWENPPLPDSTILDLYNKRKKEGDPPMPCTVPLPSECPCFDQAFVDKIDGYDDATPGSEPEYWNTHDCITFSNEFNAGEFQQEPLSPNFFKRRYAAVKLGRQADTFGCEGQIRNSDGEQLYMRWITTTTGGITADQYAACRALIESAPVCN